MAPDAFSTHSATPAELQARVRAEARHAPFLVVRDVDDAQRILELDVAGGHVRIGRDTSCDLPLDGDPQVSRLHAELDGRGNAWTVSDHGLSRNGSYLNGERVDGTRTLMDGDVLRFGDTHVLFRAPAQPRVDETLPAPDGARPPALTDTQRAVLVALCRPFLDGAPVAAAPSNAEIAGEVHLSVDRVKALLGALYETAGLAGLPQPQKRPSLAAWALRLGLVSRRAADDPR